MDLKNLLKPELVSLDLKGKNKEAIIRELVELAFRSGKVLDKEEAIRSVFEREDRMSTGMKHGIAIPHGKTTAVRELVACIGISPEEIDFDALDRKGCRIFIMTLSPIDKTGPHLQFLAEVGMLFRSEEKRQALLAAKTPEEVVSILVGNS
ncbi:MAG: PTS sugar transporter subunit IIA [Spirochaetota bacterium]|jgi:Phosphotransferase system mannitol/fructose-specific IIA domain (Ntr-type)|uniref:Putative PTS IIA-like nitrogen-regulatory protein PtsN n=1 Tax=uncultured spirochete TaxID=156406 RepID=A0A3P3XLI2_9SPIR|nr:PTS sugar transporter subunit IIA [Rectinema subterraneum]SLM15557.1 putative PTS IIA-like nitrogen-regulatory protein PtsN [uncultured spirochete]HCX95554.1 PTS sucrose transporter subunit IIABC [Spirochaetaceae bacterium]